MEQKKWCLTGILVSLSAILGVLPYMCPYWCAELVFIFLVPLLISTQLPYRLSFGVGFLWGLLFSSVYFLGLGSLILEHGYGSLRMLAYVALVLYGALCSAVWFYSTALLIRFFHRFLMYPTNSLMCWSVTTVLYFWWYDRFFFAVFGQIEGDHLRAFIIPLAVRPAWLLASAYCGALGCIMLVVLSSACLAYFFYEKSLYALFFAFLWWVPFLSGWFASYDSYTIPEYIADTICIVPQVISDDPWCMHEHISEVLNHYAQKKIRYFIFPESAFPFVLSDFQRCITSWFELSNNNDAYFIIGAHRKEDDKLYNSLFILQNCRIIHHYDKSHLMFFTERIPLYLKKFKNLFLHNKIPFIQGKRERCAFDVAGLGNFMPYLCSELFFEPIYPQKIGGTVVCLVNDSWFSFSYIPTLMFLYATCKAIFEGKTIIYVSYIYGVCIMPDGTLFGLATVRG